jgi:hypothetical protein
MLVRKTDIGADIIHILTKGMYLDPKDTIREYIQNGVDAKATDISVKIRQKLIVVQDNGTGMDRDNMRKAIRIGISEKNPSQNVGFMGIGIYSAYHLCEELHIYSKTNITSPNILKFNFKGMRDKLEKQRELRFESKLQDKDVIALQDLLDEFIELNELKNEDFPKIGTRVEMIGIPSYFLKTISEFSEVSKYLEKVVPLTFNPKFTYGKEIQSYITKICQDNNLDFSLINLTLQINDEQRELYRPYLDEHFEPHAMEPIFYSIKDGNEIYGIAWGCLNGSNNSIKNSKVRGFIIKKHGFTIGEAKDLLPYFGRQIYFNRYIGEILVVHPKLLPNSSRSEFEYSSTRIIFQDLLRDVAQKFNLKADTVQEELKAKDELEKAIVFLKTNKAQLNHILDNSDKMLTTLWQCKEYINSLEARNSKKRFTKDDIRLSETVLLQLNKFANEIKSNLDARKKKQNTKANKKKNEAEIVADVNNVPESTINEITINYENLIQVIDSLGLELNPDLIKIFEHIDEEYIRYGSEDEEDYRDNLLKLRDNLAELLNEY